MGLLDAESTQPVSSQAATCIDIERFVKAVQGRFSYPLDGFNQAWFVQAAPTLLSIYREDHDYSEHLQAFWDSCVAVGLMNEKGGLGSSFDVLLQSGECRVRLVQDLIINLSHQVRGKEFKRRESDRRYEMSGKRERLSKYARAVIKSRVRVLIVRGDLGYRKDSGIEIADVFRHIAALRQMIQRRQGIFADILGYALCIEQGESREYHIHFAYFLSGREHQRDGYYAKQLGVVWKGITGEAGSYFNCHVNKAKYERLGLCGIGMIHRDNELEVENAVRTICYLADPEKEGQFLRMKPAGRQTFATGVLKRDGIKRRLGSFHHCE